MKIGLAIGSPSKCGRNKLQQQNEERQKAILKTKHTISNYTFIKQFWVAFNSMAGTSWINYVYNYNTLLFFNFFFVFIYIILAALLFLLSQHNCTETKRPQ